MLVLVVYLLDIIRGWGKILVILIMGLVLLSLYFTYSRMAWLSGGGFIIAWWWSRVGQWRWLYLAALLLLLLNLKGFITRILALITLTDSSLWYRIRIWQGVIKILPNYWIWGAGPGSFARTYFTYQRGVISSNHAHELFLQLWVEHGIFSLSAFLILMAKLLAGFRRYKPVTQAVAIVIIIFMGYGFSETWWQSQLIGGYFWLFCGMLLSLQNEGKVYA